MKSMPVFALAVSLSVPLTPLMPLGGCTPGATASGLLTPANIAEAKAIVSGLSMAWSDVRLDFPNLVVAGSPVDNDIATALNVATAAANGISAMASPTDNASALRMIATSATAILDILATALPAAGVPPEVMLGLQAAQLLLPDLIALAGPEAPAAMTTVSRTDAPRTGAATSPTGAAMSPTGAVMPPTGAVMSRTGAVTLPTGAATSPAGAVTSRTAAVTPPSGTAMPAAMLPDRFRNAALTRDAALSVLAAAR